MTYAQLIAESIGTDEPATVALVEDLMRDGRTGLDDLTPAAFRALARQAHADIAIMREAGQLDYYCQVVGLVIPTTA